MQGIPCGSPPFARTETELDACIYEREGTRARLFSLCPPPPVTTNGHFSLAFFFLTLWSREHTEPFPLPSLGQQELDLLPDCGFFAWLPKRHVPLLDVHWQRLREHEA